MVALGNSLFVVACVCVRLNVLLVGCVCVLLFGLRVLFSVFCLVSTVLA